MKKPKRRICIGDVHGALKALVQLLERLKYNPREDQLFFVGDYVDGWGESAELIEYLINLHKNSNHYHVFIKGNHDVWCKDFLERGVQHVGWIQNGGQATLKSYVKTGYLMKKEHKMFFKNLIDYHITNDNKLFVHGGWDYRAPNFKRGAFIKKPNWCGIGAVECQWNRSLVESAMMSANRFKALEEFNEVYVGHTTTENWKIKPHYPEFNDDNQPKSGKIIVPINRFNLWNVDTGGGWSGKLTALDIDTKEYWQSDFVKELYPDEKGR